MDRKWYQIDKFTSILLTRNVLDSDGYHLFFRQYRNFRGKVKQFNALVAVPSLRRAEMLADLYTKNRYMVSDVLSDPAYTSAYFNYLQQKQQVISRPVIPTLFFKPFSKGGAV